MNHQMDILPGSMMDGKTDPEVRSELGSTTNDYGSVVKDTSLNGFPDASRPSMNVSSPVETSLVLFFQVLNFLPNLF